MSPQCPVPNILYNCVYKMFLILLQNACCCGIQMGTIIEYYVSESVPNRLILPFRHCYLHFTDVETEVWIIK